MPVWTEAESSAWRQVDRLTVSEWADRHRVLDPMFAAEPGPWRTSRVPYAREWMDSACARHVRQITLMASTQVGKSEAQNNIIGFYVHQDPSPIAMVMPKRESADLASRRRILPMIKASPVLKRELSGNRYDTKAREIAFKRCVLYFRSANSPDDLASVPVRIVMCDEVDKYVGWSGKESSPISLISERMRTFPYTSVLVLASTPVTRTGQITTQFEAGDRRRFHMPCVHCSAWIVFRWKQVRWPEDIRSEREMGRRQDAWYECQECGGVIDDRAKRAMVEAGRWVPEGQDPAKWIAGEVEDRADHRSYHIWAAYSPWLTWWKIARKFLASRDDPAELQGFTNSWLAEPWEERLNSTHSDAIAACVDDRPSGEVPDGVLVLTAAVDVQKHEMHYAIVGWGLDEEHWLIEEGVEVDWSVLTQNLSRQRGAKRLAIRVCLVDSRHRRDEVVDFVRAWPTARMIAGVERDRPVPFSTVKIDKHPRTGITLPTSMVVWTINVGMFKDLVAHRIAQRSEGQKPGAVGTIHLPNDLPDYRLAELSSEHKILERSGAVSRARWVKKPGQQRNELWDLLVYCTAAAKLIRADTLRSPERRSLVGAAPARTRSRPPIPGPRMPSAPRPSSNRLRE